MDETKSVLKDIREAVGLSSDNSDFDTDLLMHINSSIGKLNQNGVGKYVLIKDETQTWEDLIDSSQIGNHEYFQMVPLYISLSTKLLFDPPPPSSVEYHSRNIDELLWRLKIAYENPFYTMYAKTLE